MSWFGRVHTRVGLLLCLLSSSLLVVACGGGNGDDTTNQLLAQGPSLEGSWSFGPSSGTWSYRPATNPMGTTLEVHLNGLTSSISSFAVRFDISGLPAGADVRAATLFLTAESLSETNLLTPINLAAHDLGTWNDNSISGSSPIAPPVPLAIPANSSEVGETDVTELIRAAQAAGQSYVDLVARTTQMLSGDINQDPEAWFYSSAASGAAGVQAPLLHVRYR